jgi:hypothetical protein
MAQSTTTIESVWAAKGNLPDNAIVATADGKYPALDGSLITNVGDLLAANNLSELTATASVARTNLELGAANTVEFGGLVPPSGTTAEIDAVTTATIGQVMIDTDRSTTVRFDAPSTYVDILGPVRADANGAFSAGDLGGDARGTNAINIQASRSAATQVASGNNAVAIGSQSIASFDNALAIGTNASATHLGATAVGYLSNASGPFSSSSGYYSRASGPASTAVGNNSSALATAAIAVGISSWAAGVNSTAIGQYAKTTVNNTAEIGYWSNSSTRAGAIRFHSTGMVAQTIQNRATAYGDGGATKGSEADDTVIREGIALRRNGNEILVDLNIGGIVTTLSLGTAS